MQETCTTYTGIKPAVQDKPAQNQVANPNQWFRFIAPLFIHSGGIHFFLVAIVQLYIGRPIERSIGWLRMGLIYSISGVGGYLVSGVLDPYVVSCGANPAVFGLIAIMLVELIQSWKVVPSPKTQLAKLLAYIVVGFIIGSLPFIDNFSQLGGFSFGLVLLYTKHCDRQSFLWCCCPHCTQKSPTPFNRAMQCHSVLIVGVGIERCM
eukprot:m.1067758 g.1067758  ORF g.1067758 m.1067758 type:complete len:207 (-) comp24223_c1_seq9:340-960(-)